MLPEKLEPFLLTRIFKLACLGCIHSAQQAPTFISVGGYGICQWYGIPGWGAEQLASVASCANE